jgi:manganese/zinc/iron transport system substrate-binding protein
VLVTSHDAFNYLGRRYGLDVVAVQGISTAAEATTADIKRVARIIAQRDASSVFIESSVPRQTIDAVIAAARRQGQETRVGGALYADAAGDEGTPEGTYVGMVRHNVELITRGLS